MKRIELLAGRTQTDVLNQECDYYQECDTIKEAKHRAKYVMSEDYRIASEATETLRYAQIRVDGECVYDYFAKRYNGEPDKEDEE